VWVKICGITRYEDAMLACSLGTDAVGFVFTESPRRVNRESLVPWIHALTGVEKVGVFRDEGIDEIMRTCDGLGLDAIQFHTDPISTHERLWQRYAVIYAMEGFHEERFSGIPCRILIDSSLGKGMKGVWKKYDFPYILAGGLTPENVRGAIHKAGPAGVDVSSGVEKAPGIKDWSLMEWFIREAKS
jgi:phosphoribosylanthranilate isomerase